MARAGGELSRRNLRLTTRSLYLHDSLIGDHEPMALSHVVFYRNMNLGHRGSPTRAVLEGALLDAGAATARSFQTNGTVVVTVDGEPPAEVVVRAAPALAEAVGYQDAAFVRPFDELVGVLTREPFAGHIDETTYRETFTFFDGGNPVELDLPWTSPLGDLDIIEVHPGYALSVVRLRGQASGDPNSVLQKLTGVPATTRTAGTIRRLAKSFT